MLPIASPECTPKNTESDGSACATSSAVMPVSSSLGLGSVESGSAQSSTPRFAGPGRRSRPALGRGLASTIDAFKTGAGYRGYPRYWRGQAYAWTMAMDANPLGDYLRARRQQVRPADVGLVAGARRRVAGLRR